MVMTKQAAIPARLNCRKEWGIGGRYGVDGAFIKYRVVDDIDGTERFFISAHCHGQSLDLSGHVTAVFEALDMQTGKFVYIKDTWRYDGPGSETEGDIYQVLNWAAISGIPSLICGGAIEDQQTFMHIWKTTLLY